MGYCFESDASVQKDLRRIAAAQIENAVGKIDDHALDSAIVVHEARKACKKLRGLIKLVRPGLSEYRAENAAFRDIAAILSPLRDAAVLIETYDKLFAFYDGQVERAGFAPVRRRLTLRQKTLDRDSSSADRKLGDVRDLLTAAHSRIERWKLSDNGFDALSRGLGKTYKRARKAMKEAERSNDGATLHEWRMHVKYHGYHARLLEPVWPAAMQAHRQSADQLNDLLGDHHDLAVFDAALRDAADEFGNAADLAALTGLIRKRQDLLAAQTFALGAKLFAEPADQLTQRWRRYWTQWRASAATASAA
ncbi:MAG: CHAD domain-containing protein [Pseudolabrys sp.]|jgi:CHAD domain-containing protein